MKNLFKEIMKEAGGAIITRLVLYLIAIVVVVIVGFGVKRYLNTQEIVTKATDKVEFIMSDSVTVEGTAEEAAILVSDVEDKFSRFKAAYKERKAVIKQGELEDE